MEVNAIGRAILLLLLAGCLQNGWASAYKSAASGNWTNPATWMPAGVPTNTDTVEIQNGCSVTNANITGVGSLTIANGGTLQVGGPASGNRCVLTMAGSLTNAGTIHIFSPTTANQFTFAGNGYWAGSGDISSGKLRLTVQSGASLDISMLTTALKFLNNSTEANTNSGTLITGTQVINGNGNSLCTFTLTPGSTLMTANPNGITNGTTGTFNFSAGAVNLSPGANYLFCGTSAQVTAGLPANVNGLSISNAAGVALSAGVMATNVALSSGQLTTTAGNGLTLAAGGSITGGATNAFVNGPLAMIYNTVGAQTFPTGAGGRYRPVTLSYTALTGVSTVMVQQVESTLGGSPPVGFSQFTNRYWAISQVGGDPFTCSLTLDTNDFLSSATGAIIQQGTPAVAYPVTVFPPNYTAAGITALGNFTLGQYVALAVQTNILGPTPQLIGYNTGHFYPGSNTRDWWRYAGVSGARVFWLSSAIEPVRVITNAAKLAGVSNQVSFFACRAAMHTNQFNTNYINWQVITNNFNTNNVNPLVHLLVAPALTYLQGLDVQVCAQFSASPSWMPIADTNDWAGMWGVWHHYYAAAFYLGRNFNVQAYQMYNEPDLATNLTQTDYLLRLQLAADAISNALADVNGLYGKSLTPTLHAPVSSGVSTFSTWGQLVLTNRHNSFFAPADTNYSLVQMFDYHEYGDGRTAGQFGTDLASLIAGIQSAVAPETPWPVAISEFNNYTEGNYDLITNILDMPGEYTFFGATAANLMANNIIEMYCFMFSQVANTTGNYPVLKNALHYVDNNNAPYNIGGITKAGEVFRLFNKAFARGRSRLAVPANGPATNLVAQASYNPATQRYYLYSVNNSTGAVSLNFDLSALNLPAGNHVLVEEVSETNYGTGFLWTTAPTNAVIPALQNSNTIWLLTASSRPEQVEQVIAASENAQVNDGANSAVHYGSAPALNVRNDPANTANRSAVLLKFHLPVTNFNDLDFALLSINAASATSNGLAQAHVYFLDSTNWSQSTVTWSSAPNLKQNIPAGSNIINSVIQGVGTNASIVGQLVATTTNASEKLIDLTDFLRSRTNADFSILVVQDPRWDITLPAMTPGDVQADGLKLTSTEGGAGPALKIVLANASPVTNTSSNIVVSIVSGTNAAGATTNASMVLKILGAANSQFRLLATTNLMSGNWNGIYTNVFNAGGIGSYTNFDRTNYPCRYYRVVSP